MSVTKQKNAFDIELIRKDFPILSRQVNGKPLVYLDNAATSQTPSSVIQSLVNYYEKHNANVHRGVHTLAEEATAMYEGARDKLSQFIGANNSAEIVFVRNTTEAVNLIAYSWAESNVNAGDVIAISQMEHHANLVPWQRAALKTGATIKWIDVDSDGRINLSSLENILKGVKVKLLALTHVSNVLGVINPIEEAIKLAHQYGAITVIDGAQAAPHIPVDVKKLNCDFYVLSAHKMLGPTGIGALYARTELLEKMEPFLSGGSMINRVTFDSSTWNEAPYRFEAGTPNIADAIAWGAAIDYLESLGMENVLSHEQQITNYALDKLTNIEGITIYGSYNSDERVGVISFNLEGIHPHDVAQVLDDEGIAVRAGHHCCAPLMGIIGAQSTVRASFYIYNQNYEVDKLVDGLEKVKKVFRRGA